MYELKKMERNLRVYLLGNSYEKRIYRAAVSQRLRNTGLMLLLPDGLTDEAYGPS